MNTMKTGLQRIRPILPGLILLYLIQVFLMTFMLSPYMSHLLQALRSSARIETFMERFDISILMEIIPPRSPTYGATFYTFTFGLIFLFTIRLFFTGGFLHFIEHTYDRFSSVDFFGASTRNFFPLIRLQILAFFYYALVFILYGTLSSGLSRYWKNLAVERTVAFERWLLLFFFLLLFMIVDARIMHARLALIRRPTKRAREAFSVSKTLFTHIAGKSLKIYISYVLLRLALVLVYAQIQQHISRGSLVGVLFLFFVENILLFFQPYLKFAHYASQYSLIPEEEL